MCEVKSCSTVPELKKVQELFGFSQDDNWLNAVYCSISPIGEVIAFGHGAKLIILSSHWCPNQLPSYIITWKGELENTNEIITAILTLPVYGPNISSGAEWTCVAIGLASGVIVFYSDSGVHLFSQKLHQGPIQYIKAQSGLDSNEEIYIGYSSCVCVLQANCLFQTLKSLKQNFSKSLILGNTKTIFSHFTETLPCQKWEFSNRISIINDSVVIGTQKSCTFDQLLAHSFEKGFYAKCRSSPPQNSLVLAVGVKPYIGFYYAKEGYKQVEFGDVAKAIANKVISSLPLWLFKSSNSMQSSQEEIQQIPPSETISCRFGICDIQRQALNIWLSPDRDLAVVTDNLNRVILIDCNRGVALRIWKGYRDAQCAFIKAKEKLKKGEGDKRKRALFLVIYAPRRSCLEIWALQHGPRVIAFTVCKNGQLIYNTHNLFGVSSGVKVKSTTSMCLFFDPSDETIKEISVPFHCVLSESTSNIAKDLHILRRLKLYLRNCDAEEVTSYIETACVNIKTIELRLQCLDMFAKNGRISPETFHKALIALKLSSENDTIQSTISESKIELQVNDFENQRQIFNIQIENYQKLVEFYIAIKQKQSLDILFKNDYLFNGEKFCLLQSDLQILQKLLDLNQSQQDSTAKINSSKVKFERKYHNEEHFTEYLNVFSVNFTQISLNRTKRDLFSSVGKSIFGKFLEKGYSLASFAENSKKSSINSGNFFELLLAYWLEEPFLCTKSDELIEDITRLGFVIQHICDLAGEKIFYEYNSICPWWQNIREILLESSCALRSLIAAMVCRNISLQHQKRNNSPDENCVNEEVWEHVSQEAAQWSLLIGKLEDVSILGAILSFPVNSTEKVMPIIIYEKPDCSLKSILCSGKGIVAELVAKWLTNSGFHPKKIVENYDKTISSGELNNDLILKHLLHLRDHFPFSLESGVLICQMTWEFMCHWSNNLPKLEYFRAGLICLDAFRKEDYALKHGLCCMIWSAHIKIPLEATKKLINKVGKLPKEKLCQHNIGISASIIHDFLELCLQFFEHFLGSLEHNKRILKFEEILQDGPVPLSQLSLQQNCAIQEILHLHIQLCRVLHLIAFFSIKITKPITTLFDALSNQTFFVEVNRELSYKLSLPDLVLQKHRQDFLCKSISASMDLIREDLERIYVLEHATYMEKIEKLSDLWELDKTSIKRHQVVELYAHGWDAYAEELLEAIMDKEEIGYLLLEIAGRRLNLYASTSSTIFCDVASVGPLLLDYLDNLKKKIDGIQVTESAENIDLASLTNLTAKAFQCLIEKESKYVHIAGQMFDACSLLKATATISSSTK